MNRDATSDVNDPYIQRMIAARSESSVLKARLLVLRSILPHAFIFVFEGDDDKIVYGQWVRRIRHQLQYEPFPCDGKKAVRQLKNSATRDLDGLGTGVFFFVDRDFVDLDGFLDGQNVYMTSTYSIENLIATRTVLELLLRDEFPCHAKPSVREAICDIFDKNYNRFFFVTSAINRRIYQARVLRIDVPGGITRTLNRIATVSIRNVGSSPFRPEDVILLAREPSEEEPHDLEIPFDALDPKSRYRGKFALKFFRKWLGQLAAACSDKDQEIFGDDPPEGVVRRAELVLSNFAAKSEICPNLVSFILNVR